jgi:prephenate dehydrogenase
MEARDLGRFAGIQAIGLRVESVMDDLTIGVVGAGLIGGSIALAAQRVGFSVVVHDRHDSVAGLKSTAVPRRASTIKEVALISDLIFIATPISATVNAAAALLNHVRPDTIVSDVASAKQAIAPKVFRLLSARCQYIPTHPMAGSERSGWGAAHAELFQGAVTVVCEDFCTDSNALAIMRNFWNRLGSNTIMLDVITHDRLVAVVSHLPHLLASILVTDIAESFEPAFQVAGRGFRDLTRIASGSPELWTEILLANRNELLDHLQRFRGRVDEAIHLLQTNDVKSLQALLNAAKRNRDKLIG